MRLFLLGCTGFIGRELVPLLQREGHSCTLLSRQPASATGSAIASGSGSGSSRVARLQGDPADSATWRRPDVLEALADAEGVVNLAGEPIADQRWTPEHRQRLLDGRPRAAPASCRWLELFYPMLLKIVNCFPRLLRRRRRRHRRRQGGQ